MFRGSGSGVPLISCFEFSGLECGARNLNYGASPWVLGYWVSGIGFRASGFGYRLPGIGYRVPNIGFWVFGFWVLGIGHQVSVIGVQVSRKP